MTVREHTLAAMARLRVGAIIRAADQDTARRAAAAARRGGMRMIEFTLTVPGAVALIAEFAEDRELLVGAGTVLTPDEAAAAVQAGARFLVSPVMDAEVIAATRALGAISVPGTYTPTEMVAAHRHGADVVKLFPAPADIAGYVRQIRGPLPHLRLFPTAGVTAENFLEILRAGAFGVGFVSSLFPAEELAAGDFTSIERRAGRIMAELGKL